jgi:hypothetical protein
VLEHGPEDEKGAIGVGAGQRMKDWMWGGLERLSQPELENFLLFQGEKPMAFPFRSFPGLSGFPTSD